MSRKRYGNYLHDVFSPIYLVFGALPAALFLFIPMILGITFFIWFGYLLLNEPSALLLLNIFFTYVDWYFRPIFYTAVALLAMFLFSAVTYLLAEIVNWVDKVLLKINPNR